MQKIQIGLLWLMAVIFVETPNTNAMASSSDRTTYSDVNIRRFVLAGATCLILAVAPSTICGSLLSEQAITCTEPNTHLRGIGMCEGNATFFPLQREKCNCRPGEEFVTNWDFTYEVPNPPNYLMPHADPSCGRGYGPFGCAAEDGPANTVPILEQTYKGSARIGAIIGLTALPAIGVSLLTWAGIMKCVKWKNDKAKKSAQADHPIASDIFSSQLDKEENLEEN